MKKSLRLKRRLQAGYAAWVFFLALVLLMSGCASYTPYESADAFATMEECRIARRLGRISVEREYQCIIDRLPEVLF